MMLIETVVSVRKHGGRSTPIRRMRRTLDCSCGASLGVGLDWIDVNRRWREHLAAL
jgi:hypothetical protein